MVLQRLSEYCDRLADLPPTLYREAPVRYIIELDDSGQLLSTEPVDTADPGNRATRRGTSHAVPSIVRTSAVKPLLLADNGEYTLGLLRTADAKPQRAAACHRAYVEFVERCAEATGEPAVRAVQAFLAAAPLSHLRLSPEHDASATITFRVDGEFVVDLPSVQAFWAAENAPDDAHQMQCLICGQQRTVLERMQGAIKGIPDGQPSGTSLISANATAFESYGLSASLIAPVCAPCAERFTRGLNALLADRSRHLNLGGSAFVFWTRSPTEFNLIEFLDRPQPEQVRALLDAARAGRPPAQVDATAFYAATLTANGGRAVVRDWLDTTVAEAKRHLIRWFRGQRIVGEWGDDPSPLGLYALCSASVRDPAKGFSPPVSRALWRGALAGAALPSSLLHQAVRRTQAEQDVRGNHAALIKLALCALDMPDGMEDEMVQLDPANSAPAYLCGRLLAVLEQAQRLAVPNLNTTIVARFYGTASTAPATVFSHLMRGAQAHLSKLERDQPGTHSALQRRIEEILAGLPAFPRVLTLQEQGLFALGYYHQRAADRAAARERRAQRDAEALDAPTA